MKRVERCIWRRRGQYLVRQEGLPTVSCADLAEARRVRDERRKPVVSSGKNPLHRVELVTIAGQRVVRFYRGQSPGNAATMAMNKVDARQLISARLATAEEVAVCGLALCGLKPELQTTKRGES